MEPMKPMKERWKTMSLKQKTEYLWMYYKIWLLVVLCAVSAVWMGVTMYRGMHTKVLLNIVITGGDQQKAQALSEDFCRYAGIEDEDGIVRVKANIPDDGGSVNMRTSLTTLIGADAVDVLVCSREVYEEYHGQDGFLCVEEVMESAGIGWKQQEDAPADAMVFWQEEGNPLYEVGIISYEPFCATVPVNCQNQEMAARFLEYVSLSEN